MRKRGNVSSVEVVSVLSLSLSLGLLEGCNQLIQVHTATYCTEVGNIRALCTSAKKKQQQKNKAIIFYYIIYIIHSSPVSLRKANRSLLLYLVFSHIHRIPCKLHSLSSSYNLCRNIFISELYFLHHIISYSICF